MLTQGFTPTPGAEIDEMDAAALTSQLVIRLLSAVLPKGPPTPGSLPHVSHSEKGKPHTSEYIKRIRRIWGALVG